ncbi:MAG: type III secretion system inner membrane ring subunit SctD [Simkania sp.]|nr:type III secretion system inner membrane ring subunit SctD [Simkania sp.]
MAAYLIAEEGPLSGLVIRFEDGEEWVLGRDPDESGQVLEDPMVSRKHVICRLTPEGYLLENLSAVNPATQNGKVITEPVLLREGDIIQVGSTFFHFTETEPASHESSPQDFTDEPFFEEPNTSSFDLPNTDQGHWMLKVISGPNTGAEFNIETDHVYIVGKDPNVCDIVFQDLSVSRQHARLTSDAEGIISIEDLGSRNGVLVNGELINDRKVLLSQDLIALGTTSFLIIDRLETRETIFSPLSYPAAIPLPPSSLETEESEAPLAQESPARAHDWKDLVIPKKHVAIATVFGVLVLVVFLSMFALFSSKPIQVPEKHPTVLIQEALSPFPEVQFSWSGDSGKLFLVGHVLTDVDHQKLTYILNEMPFVHSVEDNVVIDEYVWQNMNALLATNPEWKAVTIHSPVPGKFVMRGYLQTLDQAQALQDYMNRQFPYLDRLDNQVVIESNLNAQIQGILAAKGYNNVTFQLSNGELVLSGTADQDQEENFMQLAEAFKTLQGIRMVKNFVVMSLDSTRTDISTKYQITGASMKDGQSYSVVVNGKILTRGDLLDGMMITSIEPNMVLLEKDGLKFKINYNLQ